MYYDYLQLLLSILIQESLFWHYEYVCMYVKYSMELGRKDFFWK